MRKGQISLDFLLAIIMFLVAVGLLLNYVNNLDTETQIYNENIALFGDYIKYYDALKSINSVMAAKFSPVITLPQNIATTYKSNTLTFVGKDNNYNIPIIALKCNAKTCEK